MTENLNQRLTVDAWAEIVIDRWLDRLAKLNIGYYFQLEDSLTYDLIGSTDMIREIRFIFNYYGKFVDMGVGKGIKLEDVSENRIARRGDGGSARRPKKWYSKVFYAQVMRLSEIIAQKYGAAAVLGIIENYDDNALMWSPRNV